MVPGVLKGTPAVTMILSSSVAKPSPTAARTAATTASLKRSTSGVTTQCRPQTRLSRRAVPISGVSAITGTRGFSRLARIAVVPDWVNEQIAFTSIVSATSRAAVVIASAMPRLARVRLASMIWR
ncbi:hypothetical protein POI8812_03566 [Pontivivens insulae]|uniref:Uncharacterized protein n=1 Tax=Pontivivens insulae TaxID=1639689 RepID=A0A2R8AG65_9RHOB|nr:hypothetical protein POI8812_03566 [Pontivivens insulae]